MAINKEGTGYTFTFAIIMVVIVGAALSIAAMVLREPQKKNIKEEKMQNILASVGIECKREEAPAKFEEFITERLILSANGELLETTSGAVQANNDKDAFNIDSKKDFRAVAAGVLKAEDRKYPLFICEKDGERYSIVPLVGKGLWGPIWGFVSLKQDLNTIYGATFDHKTETPGLGADINQSWFEENFKDKTLFEGDEFVSVAVRKGKADNRGIHEVDGITGGTITSVGVHNMLYNTLEVYSDYFKANAK